jgi:hypothetical protein
VIGAAVYQWCEFKSRRGKNKNLTALHLLFKYYIELKTHQGLWTPEGYHHEVIPYQCAQRWYAV